jgi:hypothetical protein
MNLFDVINSSQDLTFINVSITGVVKFPEDASTTRGPWFKAKLVDGQASAKIDCNKDIFTAYANKRVTFSVPAHKDGAKGFYVKRKDYNGKPQFSFGVGVIATLAGEATQDQQAANTHSQQTQAFPVNTGNTPAPQRQQQRQGVEGVVAGMAINNAVAMVIAEGVVDGRSFATRVHDYASDLIRVAHDLQAGNLSIPPNDESRAGDWDDGQGESPPF